MLSHDVTVLVEPPLIIQGLAYLFLRRESRRSTATFAVVRTDGNMARLEWDVFGLRIFRSEKWFMTQSEAMLTDICALILRFEGYFAFVMDI